MTAEPDKQCCCYQYTCTLVFNKVACCFDVSLMRDYTNAGRPKSNNIELCVQRAHLDVEFCQVEQHIVKSLEDLLIVLPCADLLAARQAQVQR